jgi:uncharacterized protein (DUF1015 family)
VKVRFALAIVRPFRALRPLPEKAAEVASPPYDVLSTEEARKMARRNPNSFLRVNKAELEFEEGTDFYGEKVYKRGKENLMRLWKDGVMIRDETPSFYIYRITMNNRSQTGLAALTSVDDYDQGVIKKHEHTRPEKVEDRANHIKYLMAQVGPVFSTFKCYARIDAILGKITTEPAETDFVADDGIRHELWVVDDKQLIYDIITAFADIPHLYIADGHHRSASASEVCRQYRERHPNFSGEESINFYLNVLFPDSELNILPYNRVIKDLGGLSVEEVLEKASEKFEVTPHEGEVNPGTPHHFGLYCNRQWYLLSAKPGSFDKSSPTQSIDASILGNNLISPILSIDNPKTDKRINFVGGVRGTSELVRLVDSGDYEMAFSLHATTIQQLIDVADAGEVMPPKSTWFEPKLRSGMVVNLLTD